MRRERTHSPQHVALEKRHCSQHQDTIAAGSHRLAVSRHKEGGETMSWRALTVLALAALACSAALAKPDGPRSAWLSGGPGLGLFADARVAQSLRSWRRSWRARHRPSRAWARRRPRRPPLPRRDCRALPPRCGCFMGGGGVGADSGCAGLRLRAASRVRLQIGALLRAL
jgi:hypothetical protein